MRYLGGKSRIAKRIAPIVNAERAGRFCWEPFCGGLGMTEHLKPDLASDAHPGLIALYNKLRVEPGWLDGFDCTESDYAFAKTLPDDSPIKAAIGFGCSFGGKWFGGFARNDDSNKYSQQLRNSLEKTFVKIRTITFFSSGSFFDVIPQPGFLIYADPPYSGTTEYAKPFDSRAFVRRVGDWRDAGSVIYVSEYSFPVGEQVWHGATLGSLNSARAGASRPIERLYRCG